MSSNLIAIRDYLGKYFSELHYSTIQEKYKDTRLDTIFDQRFFVQNNKTQMVVDASMRGYSLSISGNEIYISKELYDHPSVVVTNSLEQQQSLNPRSLYNSETFSTLAYLMCQNHLTIEIVDQLDEPIYVKYRSEFETFYSSVVVFRVSEQVDVEIIEEIESLGALNVVANYVLHPKSRLGLTTFYKNNISATSLYYRNILLQDDAVYNHIALGRGAANIIDENKIHAGPNSTAELLGVIDSYGRDFHTILYVDPSSTEYNVSVVYKDILKDKGFVTFYPVITRGGEFSEHASIEVSNITLNDIPEDIQKEETGKFISDIVGRAILARMAGAKRFYESKDRFLQLL